jgi:Fur family ferric uptake transcriptional regulator
MEHDVSEWVNRIRDMGYRMTRQRHAVLSVIADNAGRHLNSQDVYRLVKERCPEVGIATVYRTLALLAEQGFLTATQFGDGAVRYEILDPSEEHRHHHLICLGCGSIEGFAEDLMWEVEERIRQAEGFFITDHQVKFFGYCRKCQDKIPKK